eukprot:SAG11_NODE_665_length_7847_cov_13.635132_3_plen_285_part_00
MLVAGFVKSSGALHYFQKLEDAQLVYFAFRDDRDFRAPSERNIPAQFMNNHCGSYRPIQGHGILAYTIDANHESNYMYCGQDNATWKCPVACLGTPADQINGEYPVVNWVAEGRMREFEIKEFETASRTMTCKFYYRDLKVHDAYVTVIYMLFNIVVFGAATGAFLNGVLELVINPMERMCSALQSLSRTFSMLAPANDDGKEDELASLGVNIIKLTDLLKVGLGDAGARIISQNLETDTGDLNALVRQPLGGSCCSADLPCYRLLEQKSMGILGSVTSETFVF